MINDLRVWAHIITTLRGWWLPGDRRGFRSRGHRLHSSGDYVDLPPPSEHSRLRAHHQTLTERVPPLSKDERRVVVDAFLEKFEDLGCEVAAVCCAPIHAHALVMAGDLDGLCLLGRAKQLASHRLKGRSGRLWARGGGVDRARSSQHFDTIVRYIVRHKREGACVWVAPDLRSQ